MKEVLYSTSKSAQSYRYIFENLYNLYVESINIDKKYKFFEGDFDSLKNDDILSFKEYLEHLQGSNIFSPKLIIINIEGKYLSEDNKPDIYMSYTSEMRVKVDGENHWNLTDLIKTTLCGYYGDVFYDFIDVDYIGANISN